MPLMPGPQLNYFHMLADLAYTLLVLVLCFAVYYRTRESYALTKHSGIKYFRDAFILFGVANLLRFLLGITFFSRIIFDFFMPHGALMPFSIFIMGYCSTMAIFFLLMGSFWKKASQNGILAIHATAIILSLIAFFTRSSLVLIQLQAILIVIAALALWMQKHEKINDLKVTYFAVFILWLFNLWMLEPGPSPFFEIKLFVEILSLIALAIIHYKISKWFK